MNNMEAFKKHFRTTEDYTFYIENEMTDAQIFKIERLKFRTDCVQKHWCTWEASRVLAEDGSVKKRTTIGNPKVDFNRAPKWAKYWLYDPYSAKCYWSSNRPKVDKDLEAFVWEGMYQVEDAPSFGYKGRWEKSMTSRKSLSEVK